MDSDIIEGLKILCKDGTKYTISGEHDVIFAGEEHSKYTKKEKDNLVKLGWIIDHEYCEERETKGECTKQDKCKNISEYDIYFHFVWANKWIKKKS